MAGNEWWHDLRNARTRINKQFKPGEEPLNNGGTRQQIQTEIADYLDWLEEHYQEKWKTHLPAELPPSIIPWYERRKAHKRAVEGNGYWPFYRDMLPRLVKLNNHNALKVYFVYRNRANNGNKVNKSGLAPGETIVGNRTVAKEAGVHEGYVHRANKILADAGLVCFVRRKWLGGPWVKMVARTPEEMVEGLPMNRKGGLPLDNDGCIILRPLPCPFPARSLPVPRRENDRANKPHTP